MKKFEKLKNIIRDSGMSTRPEFYSGRGAILADLNSDILTKICDGIEKEFGVKASKAFVKMVKNSKELSATGFLQSLYSLYNSDWKNYREGNGVEASDYITGIMTIASAFGNNRDDTPSIRGRFLASKGIKPKKEYTQDGYEVRYY